MADRFDELFGQSPDDRWDSLFGPSKPVDGFAKGQESGRSPLADTLDPTTWSEEQQQRTALIKRNEERQRRADEERDATEKAERDREAQAEYTERAKSFAGGKWAAAENAAQTERERTPGKYQDFGSAFLAGIDDLQKLTYSAAEAVGEATGNETLEGIGERGRVRNTEEAAEKGERGRFQDIETLADAVAWVGQTSGNLIPVMVPAMAGGVAGGVAAGAAGVSATVGAVAGAFVPSLSMGIGEVQASAKEKDPDQDANAWTFVGGSAIAALDSILPGKVGSKLISAFGREGAEEAAVRALSRPMNALSEGAKGMATEALTESLQEAIGEVTASLAAKQDINWDALPDQMIEAAAAGGLMGGGIGAATGAATAKPIPSTENPNGLREPPADWTGSMGDAVQAFGMAPWDAAERYGTPREKELNPRPERQQRAMERGNVEITPDDAASPYAEMGLGDLITQGKGEAALSAEDTLLQTYGVPKSGSEVVVRRGPDAIPETGRVIAPFTVADERGEKHGVHVLMNDGSVYEELFDDIKAGGQSITAVEEYLAPAAVEAMQDNQIATDIEPPPTQEPPVSGALPRDVLKSKIRTVESRGNDNAKNPLSSASGRFQFIDSTWKALGGDPAKKNDPAEQERLMDKLTDQNEAALKKAGNQATAGNLYLAHFLGAGGAVNALANPNGKVSEAVQKANPFAEGWTNGQLAAWANRKMGGKAGEWTSNPNLAADRHWSEQDGDADIEELTFPEVEAAAFEPPAAEPEGESLTAKMKAADALWVKADNGSLSSQDIEASGLPVWAVEQAVSARLSGDVANVGEFKTYIAERMTPAEAPRAITMTDTAPLDVAAPAPPASTQAATEAALADTPFDSEAFDRERTERITTSKAAGVKHLDDLEPAIETMRGKPIYYVHDPKVRGTVRTVANTGEVVIHWADDYSAQKEMASAKTYGKTTVQESWLGPTDLKDYAVGTPQQGALKQKMAARTAPQAPPATATPSAVVDTPAVEIGAVAASGEAVERIDAATKHRSRPTAFFEFLNDGTARVGFPPSHGESGASWNIESAQRADALRKAADRIEVQSSSSEDTGWYLKVRAFADDLRKRADAEGQRLDLAPAATPATKQPKAKRPAGKPRNFAGAVQTYLKERSKRGLRTRLSAEDAISYGVPADEIFINAKAKHPVVKLRYAGIFATTKGSLQSKAQPTKIVSLDNIGDVFDFPSFGVETNERPDPETIGDLLARALSGDESTFDRTDERFERWQQEGEESDTEFAMDAEREGIRAYAEEHGFRLDDTTVEDALRSIVDGESREFAVEAAVRDAAVRSLDELAELSGDDSYLEPIGEVYDGHEAEQRDSGAEEGLAGQEGAEGSAAESGARGEEPASAGQPAEVGFELTATEPPAPKAELKKDPETPDMFGGPTSKDVRESLERKGEGRLKSDKGQKAPGEDGGLFDQRGEDGPRFNVADSPFYSAPEHEAELSAALQKMLDKAKISDRIALRAASNLHLGSNINGQFWLQTIYTALDRAEKPFTTTAHETWHAVGPAGIHLVTRAEYDMVNGKGWSDPAIRRRVLRDYAKEPPNIQREEAGAIWIEKQWERANPASSVAKIIARLRAFFAALRDAVYQVAGGQQGRTAEQIFAELFSGEIGARPTGFGRGRTYAPPSDAVSGSDGIEAQTTAEARDADALRARIAKARSERSGRLGARGAGAPPDPVDGPRHSITGTITAATPDFEPSIEERYKKAAKGIGSSGPGLIEKLTEGWRDVAAGFSRHWRPLPNEPRFADLQQQLRKLEASNEVAVDDTVRHLKRLVDGLSRKEYDVFQRKAVLDDLMWETDRSHELPFGFTPETLRDALINIDGIVSTMPNVVHAVRARKLHNRRLAEDMVKAGVLTPEQVRNPAYFRHMILDYARAEVKLAKGGKVKSPYWAKRMGSSLDINANLLEAEFDWIAKARRDIATANVLNWIKSSDHNIREDLRTKAKAENKALVDEIIAGDEAAAKIDGKFRSNIGRGLQLVKDELEAGTLIPPPHLQAAADALTGGSRDSSVFPLLSWVMDENKPGAMGAAMVLSATGRRKAWEKALLKEKWVDPEDMDGLIKQYQPEGYATWQPRPGRHMFTAQTVSEHVIDMFVSKLAETKYAGIDQAELTAALGAIKPQLVVGGDRYTMILPEELVETLDEYGDRRADGMVAQIFSGIQSTWKQWVLINPRRFVKYNLNNQSGDLDAIIAGNPRALLKVGAAWKELWSVWVQKKAPSALYQEASERGVFTSGLSAQEIPDINRFSGLRHLTEAKSLRPDKIGIRALGNLWNALQGFTNYREALFRMAAYMEYRERLSAGKPVGYGASVPNMVDAVTDPADKAALLARDLIGDYGAISVAGGWLRRFMIPFWSWTEINTKRYYRLTGNAYHAFSKGQYKAGAAAAGQITVGGALTASMLLVRMGVVFAAINLWNHLLFDDEEDDLSEDQRRQLHLILGRNSDGEVITIRLQGALSDVFGMFGFPDAVAGIRKYQQGQGTLGKAVFDMVKAPINRVGTATTPIFTTPIEQALDLELWPDMFQPRKIHDNARHIFQTLNIENEYDLVAGRPSRGYGRSWIESLVYKRDPGETSYSEARSIAYDWMHDVKGEAGGSGRDSPRSNALRDYKIAIRFGDHDAANDALDRYEQFEGTAKGLKQSLKAAHPLGPIPKKHRQEFVSGLTEEQFETFMDAERWYDEVYLRTEPAAE